MEEMLPNYTLFHQEKFYIVHFKKVIHVPKLCRYFELIRIKIGLFRIPQKFDKVHCTIVHDILSKMARREFFIFIFFSNTYTCTYVV